ncbi:hypothetical protein A6302_01111 [Methylobrevis pamukkalensis]|uniref:Uncharacterized protein n=1 Tax=Methylobrevis pamukkalensis TaxID=1439726 RepID=A0A1E3H5I6_9HYPH|nr:hypothetical protein A6302_01111 [Methylobrevis pamukkalensis]
MSAPVTGLPVDEQAILAEAEAATGRIIAAREAIARIIFGQEQVVERTLVTILSGGHGLLVGVPALPRPASWKPWAPCSACPSAASSSRPT